MAGALRLFFIAYLLQGVLSQDWIATMPRSITTLSGSCVTIPCIFTCPFDYRSDLNPDCIGVWKRDQFNKSGIIVFNSTQNNAKGTIIGNVLDQNCTTVLNDIPAAGSGQYFFRIECNNKLKWDFHQPVNITVKELPPKPSLSPSTVNVKEGISVTLTCSSAAFCSTLPPSLTWTPSLGNSREYSDPTSSMTSVLTFTASPLHNRVVIYCTAKYRQRVGTHLSANTSLTIDVLYSPRQTTVSVNPNPVLEGRSATLTCSSNANPVVKNYTWHRVTGPYTSTVSYGHKLSFNEISFNDSGKYYCVAENSLGTQTSVTTELDVASSPKILSSSNCTIYENHITCTCESSGTPSPILEWTLGGMPVNHSNAPLIGYELKNRMYQRSVITIRKTENTLVCLSTNSAGSASLQYCMHGVTASDGQVSLTIFVIAVLLPSVGLILCAAQFVIRECNAYRRETKSKSRNTAVDQAQASGPIPEDNIYMNSTVLRDEPQENTGLASRTDSESLSKSSIDKIATDKDTGKVEGNYDVLYTSIILKKPVVERDDSVDVAPSTGSDQEDAMGVLKNAGRQHESKTLEVGVLCDELVNKELSVNTEYAQVNFKK